MGQRIFDKADFYLSRGKRKRLGRLLRKHRYLLNSTNSMLVYRAVWEFHKMLPWLLEQGVHPDCKMSPTDGTPLMHAAANGDLVSLSLLLKYGANANARNERNEDALGYALAYDQWDAARYLLEHGADVNAMENPEHTHLDWMLLGQKEEAIHILRSFGAQTFAELTGDNNSE